MRAFMNERQNPTGEVPRGKWSAIRDLGQTNMTTMKLTPHRMNTFLGILVRETLSGNVPWKDGNEEVSFVSTRTLSFRCQDEEPPNLTHVPSYWIAEVGESWVHVSSEPGAMHDVGVERKENYNFIKVGLELEFENEHPTSEDGSVDEKAAHEVQVWNNQAVTAHNNQMNILRAVIHSYRDRVQRDEALDKRQADRKTATLAIRDIEGVLDCPFDNAVLDPNATNATNMGKE